MNCVCDLDRDGFRFFCCMVIWSVARNDWDADVYDDGMVVLDCDLGCNLDSECEC